jgi:hypothetical protein
MDYCADITVNRYKISQISIDILITFKYIEESSKRRVVVYEKIYYFCIAGAIAK